MTQELFGLTLFTDTTKRQPSKYQMLLSAKLW